MLSIYPTILRYNRFVYHLTREERIQQIKKQGLKPQNGERCQKIGDTNKGVYFFDSLGYLYDWIEELYPQICEELYLLRFNIKNRKWYIQDATIGDYYLKTPVRKESLQYITLSDIETYYEQVREDKHIKEIKWKNF